MPPAPCPAFTFDLTFMGTPLAPASLAGTAYGFALSSGEQVFQIASLRHPQFVLRFTSSKSILVDEGLFSKSFPSVPDASRLVAVAVAVVLGVLAVDEHGLLGAGDAILLDVEALGRIRSKDASYLQLEWASREARQHATPRRLRPSRVEEITRVTDGLLGAGVDQRATLAGAFELFRSLGAPVALTVEGLEGEPMENDRRLARAIEEQAANLGSHSAATFDMASFLGLSERQILRLTEEFYARYGINAQSWRDARNRWRVQNAALLLSRFELTVADVAREVGYASPNALARAFAKAGFPPPAVLRRRLSEMDPLR
jgi:AraC-like DNA-binding protein